MVGSNRVTFSEDGLNWTRARNLSNRALGCDSDPESGNILIAGDGAPHVYQLAPDFDPNVQFAGGTLQTELYNGNKLVAESNVIDIP